MKRRSMFLPLAVLAALVAAPSLAAAAAWDIDPGHSSAQFKVRHLMVSNVTGGFGKMTGTILWDETDITKSTVEATIDASTLDTANERRDTHLKTPDFFDVAKYPTIVFKSKKVDKAGDGRLKVTGDLTLRGVTREVVLDVEGPMAPIKDPWGNEKSGISATTKLNRQDFGVAWNNTMEGGGLVVGNEVAIMIEAELVRKKQP